MILASPTFPRTSNKRRSPYHSWLSPGCTIADRQSYDELYETDSQSGAAKYLVCSTDMVVTIGSTFVSVVFICLTALLGVSLAFSIEELLF